MGSCQASVFGPKVLKNMPAFCHTQLQWKVIEHFQNSIRKMWSVSCVKIVLIDKNILKEKIGRHLFVVYALIYPLSKFGGKLPKSFSSLQCPLWVKKLIQENRAKYVNQTGNFYFQPKLKTAISLPIFNLFQWFLFYTRDFICIITLNETLKFEENCELLFAKS